jgi:hypothetical protein
VVYFWSRCAQLDIFPWIERVASASNPADNPSREEFQFACPTHWACRRVQTLVHASLADASPPAIARVAH